MANIVVKPQNVAFLNPALVASGGGGDGRGITSVEIVDGRLIVTYTDGDIEDAGAVTAIVDINIVGTDLVVTYNNGEIVNLGRVVGQDGTNGTNGATWFQGSGVPSVELGVNGDFYLNTTTQDVSQKQSGTWVVIANIKGSQGIQGEQGIQGNTGATGPSSLQPFIDAPEELEHFTGYRGGSDFSVVFGAFVNSGGSMGQFQSDIAAFKSASILRNALAPSGINPLTLLRKASGFVPTYSPTKNDFVFELGFLIPQLPTAGENFQVEISAINIALNTGFGSCQAGIAARVEYNASAGRAAFVLETRNASVSSTAIAATTVVVNTVYKMRLRLNQPSGIAQLLLNGTVVATLSTNLPNVLLMKRILFLKTAGTVTVEAYYSYHYDRITYI